MTNYAIICGKKCDLFKDFQKGKDLADFEECLYTCAEDVRKLHFDEEKEKTH